jgi:hypothetical protein
MQRSAMENTVRRYIFVADAGMSDRAARKRHTARFAPKSQDRGAVRNSIPYRDLSYTNACSMPPRIDVLFQ